MPRYPRWRLIMGQTLNKFSACWPEAKLTNSKSQPPQWGVRNLSTGMKSIRIETVQGTCTEFLALASSGNPARLVTANGAFIMYPLCKGNGLPFPPFTRKNKVAAWPNHMPTEIRAFSFCPSYVEALEFLRKIKKANTEELTHDMKAPDGTAPTAEQRQQAVDVIKQDAQRWVDNLKKVTPTDFKAWQERVLTTSWQELVPLNEEYAAQRRTEARQTSFHQWCKQQPVEVNAEPEEILRKKFYAWTNSIQTTSTSELCGMTDKRRQLDAENIRIVTRNTNMAEWIKTETERRELAMMEEKLSLELHPVFYCFQDYTGMSVGEVLRLLRRVTHVADYGDGELVYLVELKHDGLTVTEATLLGVRPDATPPLSKSMGVGEFKRKNKPRRGRPNASKQERDADQRLYNRWKQAKDTGCLSISQFAQENNLKEVEVRHAIDAHRHRKQRTAIARNKN